MQIPQESRNESYASLSTQPLGHSAVPSTLSYLDNGVVYVGSATGDSQLVRLHTQPLPGADTANFVETLEVFPNLGPIIDFCVVDLERQGQGQVWLLSPARILHIRV